MKFTAGLFLAMVALASLQSADGRRRRRYVPSKQAGLCSWYGSEAHGHYTASGQRFDM